MGHELEEYTDADRASLPDIGYSALQERYEALKVSSLEYFLHPVRTSLYI